MPGAAASSNAWALTLASQHSPTRSATWPLESLLAYNKQGMLVPAQSNFDVAPKSNPSNFKLNLTRHMALGFYCMCRQFFDISLRHADFNVAQPLQANHRVEGILNA